MLRRRIELKGEVVGREREKKRKERKNGKRKKLSFYITTSKDKAS